MANLPENQTYIKSNNVSVPSVKPPAFKTPARSTPSSTPAGGRLPFKELMAQLETTRAAGPQAPTPMPYDAMNFTMRPNQAPPAFPVGTRLGSAPGGLLSDGNYVATFEGNDLPGVNAQVRTVPGIGQYVTDPDQADKIMRSKRPDENDYTWKTLKENALEGRSSRLFEVDHSIPLWLGGTNSPENLTVLTRAKHGQKTKAEAVALTLLFNNVIDRDEAFLMATNWENKDMSIVPTPERKDSLEMSEGQTTGQIPLNEAIKIRDAWKAAETAKPKVTFGDFWREVKRSPILYGFAKGLTAGAVKDNPDVPTGTLNSSMSTAANLGGTLLSISALGKLFGLGGKAMSAVGTTKNVLNKAGIVTEAADTARKVSVFTPNAAVNLKDATKVAQMASFTKWTPPVVLYGQTQETFEDETTWGTRATRLGEDIFYGGLTGFLKPNLAGSVKAGVYSGMASMAVDTFNGRTENLAQNTLITALTMGTLHGVSAPGVRREAEEVVRREGTRTANNVLALYTPKVRMVDAKENVPTYSLEQIDELEGQLADSLSKRLAGEADGGLPPMSEDEFMQQAQVIDAAFDTLRLSALKGPAADAFAAQKLQQFIKTVNNPKEREGFFGGVVPEGRVSRIINTMPEDLKVSTPAYIPDPERLSGVMRTTGLAKHYHPDIAGLGEFFAQPQNNYKTVIAIRRPEREGLNKFLSDNKGSDWTDSNPANTIQLVGITKTADGGVKYTSLGYVPQENRIASSAKGGRPNSINDQPEIKNGKFPEYDINFNKDNLADAMDREGLDYLFTSLRNYGYEGSASGKPNLDFPFVEFSVGKDNWARSIEAQKGIGRLKPSVAEDGAQAVLARANTTTNEQVKSEAVEEFVQSQSLPAAAALQLDNPVIQSFDSGGITAIKAHLTNAEDALSSPDAATMTSKMKEYFDVDLNRKEQMELFENKETFTTDDLFTLLESKPKSIVSVALGEMKPELDALRNSDEWEMRNVFNKMRILGKEAPAPAVKPNEALQPKPAQENVVIGGGAQPAENVTLGKAEPAAPAPAVENAVVAPAAPSAPAAQALVNKASELGFVPPTAAVKPVEAPIITLDAKKHTPRIIEAASIVIPQEAKRTTRQGLIDEITNNTILDGERILKEIPYRERLGIDGYKKQLLAVVNSTEPVMTRNPKAVAPGTPQTGGLNLPLSGIEKTAIQGDAKSHLANVALDTYRNKATLDNELYFKLLGFKKGDDDYAAVKQLQDAIDAEDFGFRRELQTLRQEMGDEEFERVYRILRENVDDEKLKLVGKAPADKEQKGKTPLGIKTGLLRDPEQTYTNKKTGKQGTYNVERADAARNNANAIIGDFIDKPKQLPEGSYMRVMAETLEAGFTAGFGKGWRTDKDLLNRLSEGSWNNVWDDLLKNSDSEATQPKDYIRALGKGQRTEAKNIQSKRTEEQYKVSEEISKRKLSGARSDADEGAATNDDLPDDAFIDQFITKERTQADDNTIPAPAKIDRKMAGLTTAVAEGIDPTPEMAMNDAIQLLFEFMPGKMNSAIADKATAGVLNSLKESGVRTSNVKNPVKKVGQYTADKASAERQAAALIEGKLGARFNKLINSPSMSGVPYNQWKSVREASGMKAKIIALGEAIKNNVYDVDIGKKSPKGNLKRTSKEELLFLGTYQKYKALLDQVNESERAKRIMEVDVDAVKKPKKADGEGYPGPMDGQGGMFGDAWGKFKNLLSNTVTYERPQEPAPTAVDMPLLKAESPHLLAKQPTNQLPGEWIGTNYDPEVRHQNRPDATSTNLGLGAAGLRIQPGMAAVPRKPGSEEAMLRLGTVLENPKTGERYLVADLMNRRFDGMQKIDFATKGTGDKPSPDYNKIFKGWKIIREGAGREDARKLVESGEWEKIKNGTK